MTQPLTERDVEKVVARMFGVEQGALRFGLCHASGNVSGKMLGELVADSAIQSPVVVVDLRKASRIKGQKPWWKA